MQSQPIVVIDDDQPCRTLIAEVLTMEGYGPVIGSGSQDAERTIRQARPAMVLLDCYGGPEGHGWPLADRLRHNPATADLPLLICSTDTTIPPAQAAWLQGSRCDLLAKPFPVDDLLAKVRSMIAMPLRELAVGAGDDY